MTPTRSRHKESDLFPQPWLDALRAQGYSDLCVRAGSLCAINDFNFTTAIVVGLDPVGYERRYCFEHGHEAREALAAWDGQGHPRVPGSSARARAPICSTRRCADALERDRRMPIRRQPLDPNATQGHQRPRTRRRRLIDRAGPLPSSFRLPLGRGTSSLGESFNAQADRPPR